jgi:hypothetical protein
MDLITRNVLKQLATTSDEVCVSFFMPTMHVEAELSQNAIRYKNLVKKARQQVEEQADSSQEAEAILEPLEALPDRTTFWQQLSDGLAAFATPTSFDVYRLPLQFDELVMTGSRFHLKPLFPVFASNNQFYLLALSQNQVKLYQGTHYGVSEIDAREIPKSLIEALFYDDPEKSLQHHAGNVVGGRHDSVFHGQGRQDEDQRSRPQDQLRRFFREVDEGVQQTLDDEEAPLILAGVDYYLPIYREINGYKHLIDDTIVAGNPDHLSPQQLHQKAWPIIESQLLEAQSSAIDAFNARNGRGGLASTDLKEVIPAAYFSRVDTLFVPIGEHEWGRYDATSNEVYLHDTYESGDDDLLDLAAVHTYLNGGTVHALRRENMPTEATLAATFRYPADVEAAENHG